jgi:hypothetical protein
MGSEAAPIQCWRQSCIDVWLAPKPFRFFRMPIRRIVANCHDKIFNALNRQADLDDRAPEASIFDGWSGRIDKFKKAFSPRIKQLALAAANPPGQGRHLAAILAADVAGYSRLMGTDEVGTLARPTWRK